MESSKGKADCEIKGSRFPLLLSHPDRRDSRGASSSAALGESGDGCQ